MSTPTDEQQMRATLRRAERNHGTSHAAWMALSQAVQILGAGPIHDAIVALGMRPVTVTAEVPEIMGAKEAAEILNMDASNLKRLSPPLPVLCVISGKYPVYLASDVEVARRRRLEQGRLRGAQSALDGAS